MKWVSVPIAGAVLLLFTSCSRQQTAADPKPPEVVGQWKIIRENGKPAAIEAGALGIIEFRQDGTMTYEEVTKITSDGKVESINVKKSQGKYRFTDGENIEIEGEDRGQIKTWSVKAVLKSNILALHKPFGQVDEFERVP